jgi:hypothetical protein
MNILLDESVPRALGFSLPGHFVRTVQTMGFSALSNGKLLKAMLESGFEVLITFDQNLPYQQNSDLFVTVVVLVAANNRLNTAMDFVPDILLALANVESPTLIRLQHTVRN